MKRLIAALGAVSLSATVLTACAPTTTIVAGTTLNIGQDALATNLNTEVVADTAAADSNAYIRELTQGSFFEVTNGELKSNQKFGSTKVTSNVAGDFTVSYTVRRDVTWNDGTPITAADLLVSWIAATGKYGFGSALSNTGLSAATELPRTGVNGRRIYVKYDYPVADWQTAMQLSVPAHLLGKLAFKTQEPEAAKAEVEAAIKSGDEAKLKLLADAFNNGFALTDQELSADLLFSSGSYEVVSATSKAVTLKAREACQWCRKATVETVRLKFYESAGQLLEGIKAAEVDLAEALDSSNLALATLVAEVDALKDQGYKYSTLQSGKIQALILNYGKNSLFGEQKFFPYPKTVEAGRQALLHLVPRQRIVDALGVPIKLTRSDSFVYLSTQQKYTAVTQSNGSADYRIQDAEKARELLLPFNLNRKFLIRVLFSSSDLNGQIAFNLLNQYASDARVKLANGSASDVAAVLKSGKYEAYLTQIDSIDTGMAALGRVQNAQSSKPSEALSALIAKLAADPRSPERSQILADIDKELFASGYGLPLYELPKVVVFSSKLANYASPASASSAVSNFELWSVAPEKQQ